MAKRADKKPASQVQRNPDRRNGKAWKKNPKRKVLSLNQRKVNRALSREGLVMQKRNEFGHVLKWQDDHQIVVCDHPKGYVHADLTK